ncbi:outer membrane beta-barrel protein [Candidatus Bipolaricaulota bacterium]|nr:outer membrane beta-barrel protein [Candidatus Bipolaricaulota bacterium]
MSNRPKLLVVLFSLILATGIAFSSAAGPLEFSGGGLYTTLALPKLNDVIDDYNSDIEELQNELDGQASISKMNNINSGFGLYGGTTLNINRYLGIGVTFENFSAGTGTQINYSEEGVGEIDFELGIDLSVTSAVALLNINLNEYLGLIGGGGYYFGSVSMTAKGTIDYEGISESFDEEEKESLSGLGYKFGGTFSYPLTSQASLSTTVSYRLLNLGIAGTGLISNGETLNANGLEVKVGIAF